MEISHGSIGQQNRLPSLTQACRRFRGTRNPKFVRALRGTRNLRFVLAFTPETEERPRSVRERLLEELAERKRPSRFSKEIKPKIFILKPPLNDEKLAQQFLNSPQLALKKFPLLSSCLPFRKLTAEDDLWINDFILEAKQALGYPLDPSDQYEENNPAKQFDTVLYLALQYPACERTKAAHVRFGHSRLSFIGQPVLELALAEYLLQRYPRERVGPIRERVISMITKHQLTKRIKAASLQNLVFQYDDMNKLKRNEREPVVKSVFFAIFGAVYVCFGMAEVYRVLSEAFGIDPDAEDCVPGERRQLPDIDYLSPELDARALHWKDIVFYKAPEDALFRHPRLFRACVPPGMHRFRGNYWDYENKPRVMKALGYPLASTDGTSEEINEARNIELGLGLQLCYMHPSLYVREHPRFCFERLEYLGQKIQDMVMAERLVMKHLDAPGIWLARKHRRLLLHKHCAKHLREKGLQNFVVYGGEYEHVYETDRRYRSIAITAVQQALHGLAYTVYGKREVRRLMFDVFDFEQNQPQQVAL